MGITIGYDYNYGNTNARAEVSTFHQQTTLSTYLFAHPDKKYSAKKLFKKLNIRGTEKDMYKYTLDKMVEKGYKLREHSFKTLSIEKTSQGKYVAKTYT